MEINEAKKALLDLRVEFRKKLMEYEQQTGMSVESVYLRRVQIVGGVNKLVDVEIEVKL